MGIVRKEKYLREIATMVGKGGFEFKAESRPSIDGSRVFVGSVSYDPDRGGLDYTLCNEKGVTLVSAYGIRPLEALPETNLKDVHAAVSQSLAAEKRLQQNMEQVAGVVLSRGKAVHQKI